MIVRKAKRTDCDEIVAHDLTLAEETEQWIPELNTVTRGVQKVLEENTYGFYLVVEEDGIIIGQVFVTSEWSDWRNASIWWLHRIYIQKKWRSKGIFRLIIDTLLDLAKDTDIFAIRLYVQPTNMNAKEIYEHMGFSKTSFEIFNRSVEDQLHNLNGRC